MTLFLRLLNKKSAYLILCLVLSFAFYSAVPEVHVEFSSGLTAQEITGDKKPIVTDRTAGGAAVIRPIPLYFQPAMFKGDSGRTRIVLALGIPHAALEFQESMFGKGKCPLDISIEMEKPGQAGRDVLLNKQIVVWASMTPPDKRGYFLSQEHVTVPPGEGELSVQVMTVDERRFGKRNERLQVRSFEGDSLSVSSIQPAYRIDVPDFEPAGGSGSRLSVVPYPFNTFVRSYPVFAYFQIYNLKTGETGLKKYTIDYRIYEIRESISIFSRIAGGRKEKFIHGEKIARSASGAENEDYISFDPGELNPGFYLLTVSIADDATQSVAQSEMPFSVINDPAQLLP